MARLAVTSALRILALVDDERAVDVSDLIPDWHSGLVATDIAACLARYPEVAAAVTDRVRDEALAQPWSPDELLAPSPRPNTVFAAPVNFRAHQGELRERSPQDSDVDARHMGLIVVASSSIIAPAAGIELPELPGREFHYEGEVAVVIGRGGRAIPRERALEHVLGYTGLLDVTLRLGDGMVEDRSMRKSYATTKPLGPVLVTTDEVLDPAGLSLRLDLNGTPRQEGDLGQLIVDVPGLIATASSVVPLEPGDVIATGTPAGVGPLGPGDDVTLTVSGVGALRTEVRARAW